MRPKLARDRKGARNGPYLVHTTAALSRIYTVWTIIYNSVKLCIPNCWIFIYKCKVFGNGALDVFEFLVELKNWLQVEKLCCQYEGHSKRTIAIWQEFYDEFYASLVLFGDGMGGSVLMWIELYFEMRWFSYWDGYLTLNLDVVFMLCFFLYQPIIQNGFMSIRAWIEFDSSSFFHPNSIQTQFDLDSSWTWAGIPLQLYFQLELSSSWVRDELGRLELNPSSQRCIYKRFHNLSSVSSFINPKLKMGSSQ